MRKLNKIIGIYKITSPSGCVYIGQSRHAINRFKTYKRYCCKNQIKLYASLKSYGSHAHTFEIIYHLPDDIEQYVLDCYEQLYMDQYRECGFKMLNIAPTAGGTMLGFKFSDISKQKMSKAHKGKIISDAQKAAIAKANKERIINEETRQKISAARTGNATRPKGYKHTPDAIEKIKQSKVGVKRKKFTNETKARMSLAQLKRHAK
jgi:group I intron endonuclease